MDLEKEVEVNQFDGQQKNGGKDIKGSSSFPKPYGKKKGEQEKNPRRLKTRKRWLTEKRDPLKRVLPKTSSRNALLPPRKIKGSPGGRST